MGRDILAARFSKGSFHRATHLSDLTSPLFRPVDPNAREHPRLRRPNGRFNPCVPVRRIASVRRKDDDSCFGEFIRIAIIASNH